MDKPSANLAGHVLVYLKGIAMGVSDSVPGVSGGTIAVIANIYDRLIYAIRAMDGEALDLLLHGRLSACWRQVDGAFLLPLGLGMASGLLLSANLILILIENWPEPLRAFFIGLIAAAVWLLRREAEFPRWRSWILGLAGAALVLAISAGAPAGGEPSIAYLFLCGMIAISAMLLPGLSGAFILLLLGAYEYMLGALASLDLPPLLIFLAGCALGVLLMSRIVARLLRARHSQTYAFICGLLAGSVPALWPWQTVGQPEEPGSLIANEAVWPGIYAELAGRDPMLLFCFLALAAGLGLTLLARRDPVEQG